MFWLAEHPLQAAVIVAAALAAVLALRASERPLFAVLAFAALSDVARELLGALLLRPERTRLLVLAAGDVAARAPFAGWPRAAFHLDQALELGWPFAVALFALTAFGSRADPPRDPRSLPDGAPARALPPPGTRRASSRPTSHRGPPPPAPRRRSDRSAPVRRWAGACALYLLTALVVAALYPTLSGAPTARYSLSAVYLAAHLGAALVTAGAFLRWLRGRSPRRPRHLAALILGSAELLIVGSGPGPFGFWTRWDLAQLIYLAAFGALALLAYRQRRAR